MTNFKKFLFCAAALILGAAPFRTFAAEPVCVKNAVLYPPTVVDGRTLLRYDGYRSAPIAENVVVSDATGSGIADLAGLADAIGTEPDFDALKLGGIVGAELNDALVADVTTVDGLVADVAVKERFRRPLVGVSWAGTPDVGKGQATISRALTLNGARALLLPRLHTDPECDALLGKIDGFVMPGGTNMNPARFGEVPYPHGAAKIDYDRDENDILVTQWIIRNNVPGFWICRGVQFLNVALGGGLIQDVPTWQAQRVLKGEIPWQEAEPIPDDGAPGLTANDPVTPCVPPHYRVKAFGVSHMDSRHSLGSAEKPGISDDSKFLLPIIGANHYPSVLTWHHMAVDPERVGKGLTVVAHAPDGLIEALEYQANDFALGTQFHPEYDSVSADPERRRFGCEFFKALVASIRARQ